MPETATVFSGLSGQDAVVAATGAPARLGAAIVFQCEIAVLDFQ